LPIIIIYEFVNCGVAQSFTARFVKICGFRIQNSYEHFLATTVRYPNVVGDTLTCIHAIILHVLRLIRAPDSSLVSRFPPIHLFPGPTNFEDPEVYHPHLR
jgi:hypothetical protein